MGGGGGGVGWGGQGMGVGKGSGLGSRKPSATHGVCKFVLRDLVDWLRMLIGPRPAPHPPSTPLEVKECYCARSVGGGGAGARRGVLHLFGAGRKGAPRYHPLNVNVLSGGCFAATMASIQQGRFADEVLYHLDCIRDLPLTEERGEGPHAKMTKDKSSAPAGQIAKLGMY